MRTGIIGGGLCGLSAAVRLAQRGAEVDLFEAAPTPGGRTRSFVDAHSGSEVDNGPHLLSGAYRDTVQLLDEAGASGNITWQRSLSLPLWDAERGHFRLNPTPSLPLALSLPWACARLPSHSLSDIPALLRLASLLKKNTDETDGVEHWLHTARIPPFLIRDLLEPMCLGAMNEPLNQANAASFRRVLNDAFSDHSSARLGWFNRPLAEALIRPLSDMAQRLGVRMHCGNRIRDVRTERGAFKLISPKQSMHVDSCIIALPLRTAQQLLGQPVSAVTRRITNIHLWFSDMPPLPHPFIGGIGTTGQWFFDVSSQMRAMQTTGNNKNGMRHICVVISADSGVLQGDELIRRVCHELSRLTGDRRQAKPDHARIVSEHHATQSVAPKDSGLNLPAGMVDACEAPFPGGLPATLEEAVRRGNKAAESVYLQSIA